VSWFKPFGKAKSGSPQNAGPDSLNRYSPRSRRVLALAQQEAERLNHNFIGTEHLLLGVIHLGTGVAFNVLVAMKIDLEAVRKEVQKIVGVGPNRKLMATIPDTPRVKKVFAFATEEAHALNHTSIGTEHILLGLLREGDGVAGRVLKKFGVDTEKARLEILKALDPRVRDEDILE
jgi:ATP-dependent Clp protease ATP-binding subunit ClpC